MHRHGRVERGRQRITQPPSQLVLFYEAGLIMMSVETFLNMYIRRHKSWCVVGLRCKIGSVSLGLYLDDDCSSTTHMPREGKDWRDRWGQTSTRPLK